MTDEIHPVLRETVVDRAQTTLRAITSLVDIGQPGLGSIFGELVQVILPANREERMAKFVTELDVRLKDASVLLANVFRDLDAEQLALLEDGLRASARATQESRIEQIADLVTCGVAQPDEAARQRGVIYSGLFPTTMSLIFRDMRTGAGLTMIGRTRHKASSTPCRRLISWRSSCADKTTS